VITLAVMQALLGYTSEARWPRHVRSQGQLNLEQHGGGAPAGVNIRSLALDNLGRVYLMVLCSPWVAWTIYLSGSPQNVASPQPFAWPSGTSACLPLH
jgi:hypothetical protein